MSKEKPTESGSQIIVPLPAVDVGGALAVKLLRELGVQFVKVAREITLSIVILMVAAAGLFLVCTGRLEAGLALLGGSGIGEVVKHMLLGRGPGS
jgi:hypothetical protein